MQEDSTTTQSKKKKNNSFPARFSPYSCSCYFSRFFIFRSSNNADNNSSNNNTTRNTRLRISTTSSLFNVFGTLIMLLLGDGKFYSINTMIVFLLSQHICRNSCLYFFDGWKYPSISISTNYRIDTTSTSTRI